jgi:hypothetical protein
VTGGCICSWPLKQPSCPICLPATAFVAGILSDCFAIHNHDVKLTQQQAQQQAQQKLQGQSTWHILKNILISALSCRGTLFTGGQPVPTAGPQAAFFF